jgi:hypothetical protein
MGAKPDASQFSRRFSIAGTLSPVKFRGADKIAASVMLSLYSIAFEIAARRFFFIHVRQDAALSRHPMPWPPCRPPA